MPAKRAKDTTTLPEPFELTEATLTWLTDFYPTVDPKIAHTRFESWACEMEYRDWQRAFRNSVIRAADRNELGPMLKKIKPKTIWDDLLTEATAIGFRQPNHGEKIEDYRLALQTRRTSNINNVTRLLR